MRNTTLAKAVRLAMIAGLGASSYSTATLAAENAATEDVERISVTGSRIKRTDMEGASPVTVMTTEDMKVEGNFTVADALRNSTLNSFGSFSEKSGSSAQSQATLDLRGAGDQRTLVLLDGKRLPGSPTLGGAAANLNAIPMAAVERIEILTDGASSTYGSDAIAGVVNIILKKNFEGLEFSAGAGSREADGGTTSNEFSLVAGYNTDKGNITFSFDHQKRVGIADGDRDYTAAWARDLNGDGVIQAYTETDGMSIYGATIASPDGEITQAAANCDELTATVPGFVGEVAADDDWGPGSTYCMYAFSNVSYNKASIDRNTVFVDANYEIAEDVEFFARAMFVQNKSFGRYAPPAATWDNMPADHPDNPFGEATTGYYRWHSIGTRDGLVDDYQQDYLAGFKGNYNDVDWEVYYHHNATDNKSIGKYYLSYGGLAHNVANDIPLDSEEGVNNLKTTTLTEDAATFDQFFAGIGFDALEAPGGPIAHYIGAEYFEQDYSQIYDGQSSANLVGGSAGASAAGERDVTAVFYEMAIPVTEELEVNLAVRWDDYSDFGSNTSPKISARYQLTDDIVVRASYSEAFRAPALDELYGATSFDAESAIDYVGCTAAGIADSNCTSKQHDTWSSSNPNLKPETSEYLNFGVAWDAMENVGIKLDYFNLEVDDVIQEQTLQSLINRERNGSLEQNDVFYIQRNASGKLLEAGTGFGNGAAFNIEGVDFTINTNFETPVGDFGINWVNSFILSYEEELIIDGPVQDTAGWELKPDYRSTFTTSWTMDAHRVAWHANYIDSTAARTETIENTDLLKPVGKLDSWLVHNITYTYDSGEYGALTLTVANATDEDPILDASGKYAEDYEDLYNNFGREYRVSYTYSF